MCLFIIHHYRPCLHMRGHCAEQCLVNKAAPGVTADDCAGRREIYLDDPEPEWDECPICSRKKTLEDKLSPPKECEADGVNDGMRPDKLRAALNAMMGHVEFGSKDGVVAPPNTEVTDWEGSVRAEIVAPPNSIVTDDQLSMDDPSSNASTIVGMAYGQDTNAMLLPTHLSVQAVSSEGSEHQSFGPDSPCPLGKCDLQLILGSDNRFQCLLCGRTMRAAASTTSGTGSDLVLLPDDDEGVEEYVRAYESARTAILNGNGGSVAHGEQADIQRPVNPPQTAMSLAQPGTSTQVAWREHEQILEVARGYGFD